MKAYFARTDSPCGKLVKVKQPAIEQPFTESIKVKELLCLVFVLWVSQQQTPQKCDFLN
jgi:hypothetical protein